MLALFYRQRRVRSRFDRVRRAERGEGGKGAAEVAVRGAVGVARSERGCSTAAERKSSNPRARPPPPFSRGWNNHAAGALPPVRAPRARHNILSVRID